MKNNIPEMADKILSRFLHRIASIASPVYCHDLVIGTQRSQN